MTTKTLLGPYRVDFTEIATVVPRMTPGVFALGHLDHRNLFFVNLVGRSDVDLQSGLLELIGTGTYFKFGTVATSKMAFERECELFHHFRPSGNLIHPVRSDGKDWTCPHCRTLSAVRVSSV